MSGREYAHCRGLYCLSRSHARWLQDRVDVPVVPLVHPTELPEQKFDTEAFLRSERPVIAQIGWWLRRLHSIYELPTRTYGKVFLATHSDVPVLLQRERKRINFTAGYDAAEVMSFLPNETYDDLLSKSIVFAHLYASSANNVVIECIARATPLLINPLEAVREYLGDDYPLYFETLEEAARKAEDRSLILRTHEYLKHAPFCPN